MKIKYFVIMTDIDPVKFRSEYNKKLLTILSNNV